MTRPVLTQNRPGECRTKQSGELKSLTIRSIITLIKHYRSLRPLHQPDSTEQAADRQEVVEAQAVLGRLHRGRNRRHIASTLGPVEKQEPPAA